MAPAQEPGLTWKQRYLAAAADASRSVITGAQAGAPMSTCHVAEPCRNLGLFGAGRSRGAPLWSARMSIHRRGGALIWVQHRPSLLL